MSAPMARQSLCQLFTALAGSDPLKVQVAEVLTGLNATEAGRADLEPDYDARFGVCGCSLYIYIY